LGGTQLAAISDVGLDILEDTPPLYWEESPLLTPPKGPSPPATAGPASRLPPAGPRPWHEGVAISPALLKTAETSRLLAEEALTMLAQIGEEPDWDDAAVEAFLANHLLPIQDYVPGSCSLFTSGWQTFVDTLASRDGTPDSDAAEVVQWLQTGYPLQFQDPATPALASRPGTQTRRSTVAALVKAQLGPAALEGFFSGPLPPIVHLPNFRSALDHPDTVTNELQKLLQLGTIAAWTPDMGQPHLINPLGVVLKGSKPRLVMGPLVLNEWEVLQEFSYETLTQFQHALQPEDWLYKQDAKAGYHHIPIHPSSWKFLTVFWQGTVYYYRYLPFGLKSACFAYTKFMQVVNRVTRKAGEVLLQYIDDACGAAPTRNQALHRSLTRAAIGAALGIYYSEKSIWLPRQCLPMLGVEIVTNYRDALFPRQSFVLFRIPQEKMMQIQTQARQLLEAATVTKRQIASVAGKLLACSIAAEFAPLYVRGLYDATRLTPDWDQTTRLTPEARADLQWIASILPEINGRHVIKPLRAAGLRMVADASDFGMAAQVYDLQSGALLHTLTAQLPTHLLGASSLLREATNVAQLFQHLHQLDPSRLTHKRLHIVCDNQGAIANFSHMKASTLPLMQPVHSVYFLALRHDIQLTFQWIPRTSPVGADPFAYNSKCF